MHTSPLYKVKAKKTFETALKKLSQKDQKLVANVVCRLANGEKLEPRYKVHRLKGKLHIYNECHIRGDLVLVYKIDDGALILTCINVGKHSIIFG